MTNLVLIMSDQHAQRVAGCYGDSTGVTPNIDRLASEGVTFDNAYCPSPICLPSRMSTMTARHPFRQACWTNTDFLASDIPTMAHALGAAGFRPTLIGRMHALGPDQLHGYVDRLIGDHSSNWIGIPRSDMGPLHNTNDPHRVSLKASGVGLSAYDVKDEEVAAAAVTWLEAAGARRQAGETQPFALTIGFMLPHPPYVARASDFQLFVGRVPKPAISAPAEGRDHPWLVWWRKNRDILNVDEADIARARTAYYALTWRLDRWIGDILTTLDRTGLAENTLVVYTSDHGEHIGERGLWWKHSFYDESLKVPLILRWPGQLPAGERRGTVVSLIDLAPTILEALAAPPLPNADGRSFLSVARQADAPWTDEAFAEYCTDATPDWTGGMAVRQRALRSGRWKLAYYHGYRPQLFDLATDPREETDLAECPRHSAIRAALMQRLLADWDPLAIDRIMRQRNEDKALIGAWARATNPPNSHYWPIRPEHNRLDRESDS